MTSNAIDRMVAAPAAPVGDFLGQATAVEQSRAVAEVHAAVVVAQQRPRSRQRALTEMREVCRLKPLAERAFYRFNKGDGIVTGPSIHVARELARIWGNVQYGISELRRDDERRLSEMQAVAWDLETNTRAAQVFVVPHKRDTKKGVKELVDLRDVYENNANMGARRVRAALFSIMPSWFTDEAVDLCNATLRDGGGIPLAHRIASSIEWYAAQFGITEDQLESKLGRPVDRWNEHDLAQLKVIGRSLQNGEITRDEEFPVPGVSADEIRQQAGRATAPAPPVPGAAPGGAAAEEPDGWREPSADELPLDGGETP
jgi:hypothetical protein